MDRQRPKLSRAATQPNNFLDRRLVVSGFAFMVGVSLFLGARNTQNMGVDDNISVSANNYAMPSRALAAHQAQMPVQNKIPTVISAAKPTIVIASASPLAKPVAITAAHASVEHKSAGTATFYLSGGKLRLSNGQYFDAASGHDDGLNNPEAESLQDLGPIPEGVWKVGAAVPHTFILTNGKAETVMAMQLSPMAATQTQGRTDLYLHASLSHALESDGCLVVSKNQWDELVAAQKAGLLNKVDVTRHLPVHHYAAKRFYRPISYAPNVFHTASYQTSFDAHKASVVMVPAAVPPVSVAHVQPAVTAPPPAIVQTVSVQKSVLNKVHPVVMNMAVGMGSSLLVKGGVLVAAHFGLAAMMATGPVLAGALALAVTTAVVKGVAMEAISGSGKPRDNYWYLKAAKEAVSVKKLSILAMSVLAGGVLMGAAAEAANHFGITDIVAKHASQALAVLTGKPTHAALLQHIGTAPTSVTPVHEVVKNVATVPSVPAEFGADQIGNAAQIIKQDDVMSSKLFATAHGNAVVLKHAAALLQQGTDLAKAAHLTTTRAAQHMFANLAYAQYNGVGVAKNVVGAADAARLAGNAVHGYGQHLLAMMGNAARPVARVAMSRAFANTLDVI